MGKDVGAAEVYVALRDFISHLRGTTEVYSKGNGSEAGFSKKKEKKKKKLRIYRHERI